MPINGITAKPAPSQDASDDAFFDSVDEMVGQLADNFTSWARDELDALIVALEGAGGDPAGLSDVSEKTFYNHA